MLTLDDDLLGTRANDSQTKTLSTQKVDKEEHTADNVACAFHVSCLVSDFGVAQKNKYFP